MIEKPQRRISGNGSNDKKPSFVVNPPTIPTVAPPIPTRPVVQRPSTRPVVQRPSFESLEPFKQPFNTDGGNVPVPEEEMSDSEVDEYISALVASGNPATDPEVLDILAYYDEDDIRWNVASNPNTPFETLYDMAEFDEDPFVRLAVLSNEKFDSNLMNAYKNETDAVVFSSLLESEYMTPFFLKNFFHSESDDIIDILKNDERINSYDRKLLRKTQYDN